jgi:creatinine amidohydrolase
MLHLRPDLVRMEAAEDFRSAWLEHESDCTLLTPEGAVGFGWETQDLNTQGALGNAKDATAELGAAILEHAATRLATLFAEVAALDIDTWMRDAP